MRQTFNNQQKGEVMQCTGHMTLSHSWNDTVRLKYLNNISWQYHWSEFVNCHVRIKMHVTHIAHTFFPYQLLMYKK